MGITPLLPSWHSSWLRVWATTFSYPRGPFMIYPAFSLHVLLLAPHSFGSSHISFFPVPSRDQVHSIWPRHLELAGQLWQKVFSLSLVFYPNILSLKQRKKLSLADPFKITELAPHPLLPTHFISMSSTSILLFALSILFSYFIYCLSPTQE